MEPLKTTEKKRVPHSSWLIYRDSVLLFYPSYYHQLLLSRSTLIHFNQTYESSSSISSVIIRWGGGCYIFGNLFMHNDIYSTFLSIIMMAAMLVARLLATAALLVRIQTISQKYKMGDISKGVANTL